MSRKLTHNPHDDNLQELYPLDLNSVNSFFDLTNSMKNTSFGGRKVGEAVEVLVEMYRQKVCFKVLTLSGAMTAGKMGLIITEMIERKVVNAIVSTGALISHGLVENTGKTHYKYDKRMKDEELYEKGYDRIYDTLELETNLDDISSILERVLEPYNGSDFIFSSGIITNLIGKYLDENDLGIGILRSAYRNNVPIYIPAFTDSVLGLYFELVKRKYKEKYGVVFSYDPYIDLNDFASLYMKSDLSGIFTIGGGVPRNWAQQVGWFVELVSRVSEDDVSPKLKYKYGVRICPEPDYWGGLSGCTYTEGISWGKFVPPADGGKFVEVISDATIVWPLIMKAVFEKLDG